VAVPAGTYLVTLDGPTVRKTFKIVKSTATNKNGVSSTSTTATLDKGVPYSWRVTSKNTTTTTINCLVILWKFYLAGDGVVNYAPFPADLTAPASGSTITLSEGKGNVYLGWFGS